MKVRFFRVNKKKFFIINMPTLSKSNMVWLFRHARDIGLVGTATPESARQIFGYSGALDKLNTIIVSRSFDPKDVVILKQIPGFKKSTWKRI